MIKFSIILPVKNGGEYLKESVNSILSQSILDFNLIILDSGSTDGTVEWINTLKDPRIIFYPSDNPLTIEQNWDRIRSTPRNEWMTIIGHDDFLHPQYLQVMTELINKYPSASLYGCHFNFINENGAVIRKCKQMDEKLSAPQFLKKIMHHDIDAVSLIVRSKDYDSVGGIPFYPSLLFADYVLWVELARIAYMVTASENCLSYRIHKRSTTITSSDEAYHQSYDMFIKYLSYLKSQDQDLNKVINKNVKTVLRNRCLEFSKRFLKTDKKHRKTFISVSALVRKHKDYADLLIDNNSFNPFAIPQIWIAIIIDSNSVSRKAFTFLSSLL